MARRPRNPWLATLDALTRSARRAQRTARKNPLAVAAERSARKMAKQAARQTERQIRQAGEQWRRVTGQAIDATRQAGQRQARRAADLTRQALTGVVTPVDAPLATSGGQWSEGRWTVGPLAGRRYRLFRPDGLAARTPVPLLVLLHGCGQDSACIAVSTRVARLACSQRFIALLPEQPVQANAQRCWNWFRGDAFAAGESTLVMQIIEHVARRHPVDRDRIYALGLSAGATMATTLALRYPDRIRAVASHSGPLPFSARNAADTARSMHGHPRIHDMAVLAALRGRCPPPLLILQGDRDPVIDARNADQLAALWLSAHPAAGASAAALTSRPPQVQQRGERYPMRITDWPDPAAVRRRAPYVRLVLIEGLDHAWSGGAARQAFSDPKGPDALKLAWRFFTAG
ncbi:MAG: PHB depolymerase family esterase [Burkholderiaceae bacterium]